MAKGAEAFRSIGEVAKLIGVAPHVLRYWETQFALLKPMKRADGRRYYRPADLALAAGLVELLRDEGLTIRGARMALAPDRGEAVRARGTARLSRLDPEAAALSVGDMAIEGSSDQVEPTLQVARPDNAPSSTEEQHALFSGAVAPEALLPDEPAPDLPSLPGTAVDAAPAEPALGASGLLPGTLPAGSDMTGPADDGSSAPASNPAGNPDGEGGVAGPPAGPAREKPQPSPQAALSGIWLGRLTRLAALLQQIDGPEPASGALHAPALRLARAMLRLS